MVDAEVPVPAIDAAQVMVVEAMEEEFRAHLTVPIVELMGIGMAGVAVRVEAALHAVEGTHLDRDEVTAGHPHLVVLIGCLHMPTEVLVEVGHLVCNHLHLAEIVRPLLMAMEVLLAEVLIEVARLVCNHLHLLVIVVLHHTPMVVSLAEVLIEVAHLVCNHLHLMLIVRSLLM